MGGYNRIRDHWRSKSVHELKTALAGYLNKLRNIELPLFTSEEKRDFDQTTFTVLHIKDALIFKGETVVFIPIFPISQERETTKCA
jgi:hypothetical protein